MANQFLILISSTGTTYVCDMLSCMRLYVLHVSQKYKIHFALYKPRCDFVYLFLQQKEVMASSSSLPSMDWCDSSAQSLRGREGSKGSVMGSVAVLRTKKTRKVLRKNKRLQETMFCKN